MPFPVTNIILIVMDAARADHLSAYGYSRETTPFLTQLTTEGQIYTNSFASSTWTVPSHASLFTGLYPYEHRMYGRNLRLSEEYPTLATQLLNRGFETVLFTGNSLLSSETGLTRGFDREWQFRGFPDAHPLSNWRLANRLISKWRLKWYKDQGANWINQQVYRWLKNRDQERPFFLFINYLDPHLPYMPPGKYRQMFLPPEKFAKAKRINQDPLAQAFGDSNLTSEEFTLLQALYDAELRYVDSRIGELYTFFAEAGVNDHTLWIITSDHGENIGEDGLLDHQFSILDTLLHVPLIIHKPGLKGKVISELTQQQDLYTWILKLADNDNSDILPLPAREYCLAEYIDPPLAAFGAVDTHEYMHAHERVQSYRAIRTNQYKLVETAGRTYTLFDIVQDPLERVDISDQYVDVTEKLRQILRMHSADPSGTGPRSVDEGEDEALERHLRSLGYL